MVDFRCNLRGPGRLVGSLAVLLGALSFSASSWAALGGAVNALASRVTPHGSYTEHEVTLSTGTVVREYSTPRGAVFAVGWDGPAMPDLRQVLGDHFDDYVAASHANQAGHHHLAAQRGDLVVVSTGRMRAFAGRAYLASQVPAGVSIDELR